jgi:hypothetical protein
VSNEESDPPKNPETKMQAESPVKFDLKDFVISSLMPTLVGKSLVLYFGLHYSEEPGEGYGYGLIAAILLTLLMLGRFLWKYRNYED